MSPLLIRRIYDESLADEKSARLLAIYSIPVPKPALQLVQSSFPAVYLLKAILWAKYL
jgi:hypothetical protein